MTARGFRRAAVAGLLAMLISCGKEKATVQQPPVVDEEGDLAVTLTLTGPAGESPVAGDTLVSRVLLVNRGGGMAHEVVVVDSLIPRFEFLAAESRPAGHITLDSVVRLDSLSLAAGDTASLRVSMKVPAFFPDGFEVSSQARVTYDHDGQAATPRERVLSDDPGTPAVGDRTAASVANEGADFFLLAPGVPGVHLAGEFNGWNWTLADYRLFSDERSQEWGLTLPGIKGAEQYKFVIDQSGGGEWIGDPRAVRLVADPYGGYNSLAGVPLPDPVDPLPGGIDPTRVVIYELFTYDFSPSGDIAGLMAGLTGDVANLVELGINAVELLPMTSTLGPGFNWGYNPAYYFAVDPDYGTPEEFAGFVEACHEHGIAVILDMVFNHCDGGSPLAQLDRLGTGGVFLSLDPEQGDVFGMPQLNWFSVEMREFFLDCARFWIEQYGIDGFRMDMVDGHDYDGYLWWRDQLKSLHPQVFLIGEDFGYPPFNSVTLAGMDAQWGGQHTDAWGGWANNFQQIVMALLEEDPYETRWGGFTGCFQTSCNPMWALANVMEWTSGYPTYHNEVKYIVSHDERRLVNEVEYHGSPEAAAIGGARKAKLGAATLLTAVGVPMIYMGEEVGADNYVPQDPTPNKIDWSAGDPDIRAYYRGMINLRLFHPTLAGGGIDFHCPSWNVIGATCQQNKTLCYWRYLGSPGQADIVVASNFDHTGHDFAIPFPSSGTWYLLDPETGLSSAVTVESGTLSMTLAASTAYVFLKQ